MTGQSLARDRVRRIRAAGPGVEGLVHISELSHKRVFRVTDVLTEGQDVDVMVLSVDAEQQRISLSTKALEAKAAPAAKAVEEEEEPETPPPPPQGAQGSAQGRHRRTIDRREVRAEVVGYTPARNASGACYKCPAVSGTVGSTICGTCLVDAAAEGFFFREPHSLRLCITV